MALHTRAISASADTRDGEPKDPRPLDVIIRERVRQLGAPDFDLLDSNKQAQVAKEFYCTPDVIRTVLARADAERPSAVRSRLLAEKREWELAALRGRTPRTGSTANSRKPPTPPPAGSVRTRAPVLSVAAANLERRAAVRRAAAELRAGKVLSSANQALLQQALDALSAAEKAHQKIADAHVKAASAVSDALNSSKSSDESSTSGTESTIDGMANGTPPGPGNPIMPQDGAGPRNRPHAYSGRRL